MLFPKLPVSLSSPSVNSPSILSLAMHLVVKPLADVFVAILVLVNPVAVSFSAIKVPRKLPLLLLTLKHPLPMHQVVQEFTFIHDERFLVDLSAPPI